MIENRCWLGLGVMLAASLQAGAAVVPPPVAARAAATSAAPHLTAFGIPQQSATVKALRLDSSLKDISQRYSTVSTTHPIRDLHAINPAAHFRLSAPLTTPQVLIDATTTGDPQALKTALQSLGMRDIAVYSNDVGGWLPVDQLANAGVLAEMHFARAAMPRTRSSVVATQGDFVQESSVIRSTYPSLTGTGITVGVLSDSFNCMSQYEQSGSGVPASGYNGYAPFGFTATYADDQEPSSGQAASTSALPSGVNILEEADCLDYGAPEQPPFGDEGRAILQIVHAIAPGAGLAFYTAVNSEADFANGITKLAAAGAKVIDDDVGYPDEPFFQDGLVAQAIITVAGEGVTYFSSAGNDGINSYETTSPSFSTPGSGSQAGEQLLSFEATGGSTSTALPLSIPALYPGEFIYLVIGWDQPFVTGSANSGGATSSLDLCISGAGSDLVTDNNSYPSSVSCTGPTSIGGDPTTFLIIGNPANATNPTAAANVTISIGLASGSAPGRVKFLLSDNGAGASISSSYTAGGPTIQGHPMSASAAAVGAAFYFQTPQCGTTPASLETYSSEGGDPILFSTTGARLATQEVRQKPDFVGPDGVNNTILGATLAQAQDPSQTAIYNTTITGCQDQVFSTTPTKSYFPNFFGTSAAAPHAAAAAALMLQADSSLTPTQVIAALQGSALAMTPRSTSASGYDYDDGHGFLQVDAAFSSLASSATISVSPTSIAVGSSATLTWSAINASGCTASGSWSGSQAASGTQTVTPTAAGTDTYTLTCTGTSGSVTSSTTLTVTASSSTSSTSSSHGGGALDTFTLLSLGGVLLAARRFRRREPA
jgi:hypothetical protein